MEELPSESSVEAPPKTPKEAPKETTTREDTAEEKEPDAENMFLPWSLPGSPSHEDANAESAKGEQGRGNEPPAQKGTKEDMEELPPESPVEVPQETPKETLEED